MNLQSDELQEFASQLAANITERNQLENDKKEVMSDFTARIDEKTSHIQRLAENIQSGYEYREVSCSIQYDFDRRVKTIARMDTGELIIEEVLTPDEYQQEIPGLQSIDHDAFMKEGQTLIDELDDSVESEPEHAICRNANECEKAAECAHGTPHEITDRCKEVNECHDIQPSRQAWCEICEIDEADDGQLPLLQGDLTEKETAMIHDDFIAMMNAAQTASEGRNILQAYEDRLNQLQRAAGVEPVTGTINDKHIRGFSTLSKKEVNAICKAVSKADPGIGMIHTAIIEQYPKINVRWEELLEAEDIERFGIEETDETTETEN